MKGPVSYLIFTLLCAPSFLILTAGTAAAKEGCVQVGPVGSDCSRFALLSAFELGFNDFPSADYGSYPLEERGFMDLDNGRSIHVALYLVEGKFPVNRRRTFGVSTGLGLVWDNYVFADDITLVRANGMAVPVAIDPGYKKSKFGTFSLNVPVVLGVKLNKFSLSGGVYGSIVVSQRTKYKKPKHKDKGVGYANMFQGGLTARVGFCGVNIFVNYALTDLFKQGRGPGGQPIAVGIGFW